MKFIKKQISRLCGRITASERILSRVNIRFMKKSRKCLFGREDSPTPYGVFDIVKKSKVKEEYISGYHKKYERIKFFGYLVIFEDYFIHSDLYMDRVTSETFEQAEPISNGDNGTAGCIRVSQKNVEWLLENIEVGTTVIL